MTGTVARERVRGDGDGWVDCACGRRHWGRFGAAGLLLHDPAAHLGQSAQSAQSEKSGPAGAVLLQHRAWWSHEGGTWGMPGGARCGGESALAAAVREAGEEAGVAADAVAPRGELLTDHATWSYITVVAAVRRPVAAAATDAESLELRWVPVGQVEGLPLHPGFAAAWPVLRPALAAPPLALVVDGANVVGSRPDGWWRDRAAAAGRLRDALAALRGAPVPAVDLPPGLGRAPLHAWYVEPVLVVEGAARAVGDAGPADRVDLHVQVVRAPGSGDDAVVTAARERAEGGAQVLVVTADRELARRADAVGAVVVGPGWLRARLDPAP